MDRRSLEQLLEQADRLIAEGEQCIAQQEQIVELLHRSGYDASQVNETLISLRATQVILSAGGQRILDLMDDKSRDAKPS